MMKMMLMSDKRTHHSNPTVDVPPWSQFDDQAAAIASALQRLVPSDDILDVDDEFDSQMDGLVDAYSGDDFRMYEFKIRRCTRARSHDWTECPFAHPGEKARRRDPRKYHYSGVACPDFRKGNCKRGDACEFSHGVFECWLHPSRYRTQPCKDGTACRRRVCFFAHTPDQLRLVAASSGTNLKSLDSYDGSPMRQQGIEGYLMKAILSSSPTSTLISPPISPPSESPPVSPNRAVLRRASFPSRSAASEIIESLRQMQLGKLKSGSPSSWLGNGVFGSPCASPAGFKGGYFSLPATPAAAGGSGGRWFEEDDVPAERVESGRALRARMFEKLFNDGAVEKPAAESSLAPDVAWVSELLK